MANKPIDHHEIVMGLLRKGYTYKQMSDFFDISPSMLHKMSDSSSYKPAEKTLKKLRKRFPVEKIVPHWKKYVTPIPTNGEIK